MTFPVGEVGLRRAGESIESCYVVRLAFSPSIFANSIQPSNVFDFSAINSVIWDYCISFILVQQVNYEWLLMADESFVVSEFQM